MNRTRFIIIGLDDNRQQFFPPEVERIIKGSSVFSGGLRHREIVANLLPKDAQWIDITVPLDNVFARYEPHEQIVVFASGDPLFFGFANTIRKRLPEAILKIYPAFNSLQTLAHRLLMPYDDMRIVSLTGRPWQELDRALIERAVKIGVLTDREHTPATIAQRMLEYGYTNYRMCIGEHLGNRDKERIRQLSPQEATSTRFEHPNNLILHCDGWKKASNLSTDPLNLHCESSTLPKFRPFGIPDECFEHLDGREKMITKAAIRLLTLRELELSRHHSFWDIGFCTGSISIEARLQFPHLSVTAFEIRPEGEMLMNINSRRFGVPGITVHIGDFMDAGLDAYPRPDAVFIGGHGGRLKEMIKRIYEVLLPNGTLVFNSVTEESRRLFMESTQVTGFSPCTAMSISLNEYNPIHILKVTKP